MNVVFAIKRFPFPQVYFLNQVTGLIDRGHDVQIVAVRRSEETPHPITLEYDLLDRTRYVDPVRSYPRAAQTLLMTVPALVARSPLSVVDIIRTLSYGKQAPTRFEAMKTLSECGETGVCHAHTTPTAETVHPAAAHLDVPFVVSLYGSQIRLVTHRDPTDRRSVFRTADAVTALSDAMVDRLLDIGCPENMIRKVPLAIDAETYPFRERNLSDGEHVKLLTVARLVGFKGISDAIDAIGDIADDHQIEYRIVGDGPLRERLESRVRSLDLTDTVTFLGSREHEEMKAWMDRSHLFVHPSVVSQGGAYEGTPTAILEAQATGLPVVSTHHEGIPEIVADGESGILVPEGDSAALADALERLIESPDSWPAMGRSGRKLIEDNHAPSTIVSQLEALYEAQLE